MARKIDSMDQLRPNLFDALKRAFIFKRGIIHRPARAETSNEPAGPEPKPKTQKTSKNESATENKPKEEGESYPERVASGESDSSIEQDNEDKEEKPNLKSETEGSKTAKGPQKLEELTENAHDILYEATTVWPFTLFPDTITLDREKLTLANRSFWRVATITSVPVGEIMSAEVLVGPFFGSLDLTFRFFANNERKIKYLTRRDAIEMQRLIHGYIIAHRREIDVSSVSKDELCKLLVELGQGVSD
jgi:hypothetical protein